MGADVYAEIGGEIAELRMRYGSNAELHVMALCREWEIDYDELIAYEEKLMDAWYTGPQGIWAGGQWV